MSWPCQRSTWYCGDEITDRLDGRELIRCRIQEEVKRYNESPTEVFHGLVQPEESERILNGFRLRTSRVLNWEVQFERACSSFVRNGFLLIVDGRLQRWLIPQETPWASLNLLGR